MKGNILRGDYVLELFYILKCLMPTLTEEVTGDQRIFPLPLDQDTAMGDLDGAPADEYTFDAIMKKFFTECTGAQATKGEIVREKLRGHFGFSRAEQVGPDLQSKALFKRKNWMASSSYCYHFERNGTIVWVKLRDGI